MSVPTFLQSQTQASDASAATTHTITPGSAIRSQGGSICPSALVLFISYDGNYTGNQVTSVADTDSNTWQKATGVGNSAGVNLEAWYAFNAKGGGAPTITVTTTNAVKAKLAFAELDQVSPKNPLDGTSTVLDQTTGRVDITNSTSRSSAATNATPRRGQKQVFIGGIGWNDTRTVSAAGSTWTGLVQLSGGSSNLGVGIERKSAEIQNIAGSQNISRFTMSASGVVPAACISLCFYRDGIHTADPSNDGWIDDIEGTSTLYMTDVEHFLFTSSTSAPAGGTGASEKTHSYHFFQQWLGAITGVTIGNSPVFKFQTDTGNDDASGFMTAVLYCVKAALGSTLDLADENFGSGTQYLLGTGLCVAGTNSQTLDKSTDYNESGTSAFVLAFEGDTQGFQSGTWAYIFETSGNIPAWIELPLDYPTLDVPQRAMIGVGL